MNPQELRIGNIVNKKFTDSKEMQWSFFRKEEFDEMEKYPELFSGVELTEEWFLRFGFELFPWGWVIKSVMDESKSLRLTIWNYFEREGGGRIKIEYVHQLQNIYFALIGEELKTE